MNSISFDLNATRGNVNFSFKAEIDSPITAIMGESGSGKTTLAMLLSGLLQPNSGSFYAGDKCLFDYSKHINLRSDKRGIGYVFQNYRLFPHLNVRENILFPVKWGKRRKPSNFDEIIAVLGLEPLLDRKPAEVSGGQAQRVALARGITAAEQLLILDEPLSNLDKNLRKESISYLSKIPNLLNVPLFYITHQLDEAMSLAEDGLYIDDGQIIRQGKCSQIFN